MRRIILKSLTALLFLGLFDATARSREPNSITEPNVLAEFKIDVKRLGCILLPVKFEGEDYLFFLDTGCGGTLFDISFKHKLGRRKTTGTGFTGSGEIRMDIYDAPEAFLGPLSLQESGLVGCVDIEVLRQNIGGQIHGVIGMSFLRHYVVQIDFDRRKLSFLKPTGERKRNWGVEMPFIDGRRGTPLVRAKVLDSMETYFAIDTGCLESNGLAKEILDYILITHKMKTAEGNQHTGFGIVSARMSRIERFSLGPFEYENLLFHDDFLGSRLGLCFWSRHTVTFDFPNSKVYLKKGKEFNRVDETSMAALSLLRLAGQTVVRKVCEGGPSQKAGIKDGDIILDIMGKAADSYEIWEIGQLLRSGDKRKIEMTIKRGDETKRVTIVLEKII